MKKRAQSPKRLQTDKNYIGVTAKIFAVLEYFIQAGGPAAGSIISGIVRRPAIRTHNGSPGSLLIGEARVCRKG